ncbi:MAG: AI-2E family transporter, partial [Bdellovibrionales bacterium]|nr:AI-2E family transporter [Bdellovibrionales bacterium]
WREYQNLISNLPDYLSEAKQRVLPYLGKLRDYIPASVLSGNLSESEFKEIASFGPNIANKVFSGIASVALQGYSITLAITNLFLLPFIVFYLAVDFKRLHLALLQLFPVIKRAKVKSLFLEMDQYLAAFVRGQLLVCFILSILYAIGLGLVGVELWFLLGVVSGFGNIVPYLGFLIGIVLSTIMALVTFADLSHVLAVWAVFAVVQTLEGTFITPKVVGDKVGLSPLVVILAVIAGGTLFGLLGIFLAVPGAAVLKVLFSHLSGWIVER